MISIIQSVLMKKLQLKKIPYNIYILAYFLPTHI